MVTDNFIGPIFSVAADPCRIEQLVNQWIDRILASEAAAEPFALLESEQLRAHIDDAFRILLLVENTELGGGNLETELAQMPVAAFAVSTKGDVLFANAAAQALDFNSTNRLMNLPYEYDDLTVLRRAIADIVGGRSRPQMMLRLNRLDNDRSIIMRLHPPTDRQQAILATIAQINWCEAVSDMLADAFDLTTAETEVLKELCAGKSVKHLAKQRNTGVATIRSQIHSLLGKTETRSQTELVTLAYGLASIVPITEDQKVWPKASASAGIALHHTMILRDARRLDWLERGDPNGQCFLWLPSDLGFTQWTPEAEKELARRHIRMIVPIRAGYGHSSPAPKHENVFQVAANDTLALMDHLAITGCPIVTLCDDLRIAVLMAHRAPKRVRSIMALAPGMPTSQVEHFSLMPKWARFMRANACYAPRAFAFIVRSSFGFARRIGKERFLQTILSPSRPDLAALSNPLILEALLSGSSITLSDNISAHDAFTAEGIAFQSDWSNELETCPVPISLFAGHHDPLTPFEIIRSFACRLPGATLCEYPDDGYLAAYTNWKDVVELLDLTLRGKSPPSTN